MNAAQLPLIPDAPMRRHDGLAPYVAHSATSRAAAIAILPKVGTKRWQVLDYITRQGAYGATDEEIQIALHMKGDTERPRRGELQGCPERDMPELVVDSGRTRPCVSGEQATVWVAL